MSSTLISQVEQEVLTNGPSFLKDLLAQVAPALPLAALVDLAADLAAFIQAANEKQAMQAAVQGVDAAADEAEAAALAAAK